MRTRTPILLALCFSAAISAWCQAAPAARGLAIDTDAEYKMPMPPFVTITPFPILEDTGDMSNVLSGGVGVTPQYNWNLIPDTSGAPIDDMSYSISPQISLDQTSPRLHDRWTYRQGLTIYQQTETRNNADEDALVDFQYRATRHTTLSLTDSFQKSSNVFDQYNTLPGTPISLMGDLPTPLASRLVNSASGGYSYQYSRDAMVGVGGETSLYDIENSVQTTGLYSSNTWGGSGFYSRRLNGTQYVGITDEYMHTSLGPSVAQFKIDTNSVMAYYQGGWSRYSVFLAGGPERYAVAVAQAPGASSWTPSITGNLGLQADRVHVAISFSRMVSGGGGLYGAFRRTGVNGSLGAKLSRLVSANASVGYNLQEDLAEIGMTGNSGGHSISGSASISYSLRPNMAAQIGYQRLQVDYNRIRSLAANPDSDRLSVSISYHFTRPLGR